jgi:superfamily II DNA/RNA helicase
VQHVLVVPEQEKFSELLRVLGQFDEKNETDQILIFVDTQGR